MRLQLSLVGDVNRPYDGSNNRRDKKENHWALGRVASHSLGRAVYDKSDHEEWENDGHGGYAIKFNYEGFSHILRAALHDCSETVLKSHTTPELDFVFSWHLAHGPVVPEDYNFTTIVTFVLWNGPAIQSR